MKKQISVLLKNRMMKKGYSPYFASRLPKMIIKDLFQNTSASVKDKIWAYNKGFLSSRTKTYKINEKNYKNHIPDFDYYKLNPIDGRYSMWIDDKLTMRYLLSPFSEYLPKYYFQLENNEILQLVDCPADISSNIDGILKLLQKEKSLALKALVGSLGEGFYKLSYENNKYYINTHESELKDIEMLLSSLNDYLVIEYIVAHDIIKKIYPATPNTLRLQVIKNKNEGAKIIGSFIRFGTLKSGVQESPLAGGIIAGVDLITGKTFDSNVVVNHKLKSLRYHPDTNENLEITLPIWEEIKLKIEEISSYINQLTYLGFDIIITNEGFKIIEINSLTAPTVLSYYYPLLTNKDSRKYFISKFQERPHQFKRMMKLLAKVED